MSNKCEICDHQFLKNEDRTTVIGYDEEGIEQVSCEVHDDCLMKFLNANERRIETRRVIIKAEDEMVH